MNSIVVQYLVHLGYAYVVHLGRGTNSKSIIICFFIKLKQSSTCYHYFWIHPLVVTITLNFCLLSLHIHLSPYVSPPKERQLQFLPPIDVICYVYFGSIAMGARWILVLAGGRASFLDVSSNFARVCLLLKKTRRWRLPEDGIKFSLPSLRPSGASSIADGRVEVCF